ncbi:MAG: type II toxin-antitoxin system VapC family toxin [Polaromonas sp.]|nr:type II toxin-antitoxin system VapC family toxin [Polaromonas sp.]
MIILDTNVVSEPLKPSPEPAVLAWLDRQAPETLYLTTINLAELLAGIEVLPQGRRRTELQQALTTKVMPLFEGRILSFDKKAAEAFARINASAQALGNPISFADGAIAAIASAQGFILATRNVSDFKSTGVEMIDPWV